MSGQPQHNPGDHGDDLLEQIIAQGLNEMPSPAQEPPPEGEAPPGPGHKAEEQAPPPAKKNKRSSVYLYLLVLFGAAFLMLLLAYFVQRRNNETTISDLRDSMNLSRAELMEQIQALEGEKEQLQTAVREGEDALRKEQQRSEEIKEAAEANEQAALLYLAQKKLANTLGGLERFCAEGDYLMAAAVVEYAERLFNEHDINYGTHTVEPSPLQAARYLQLQQETYEKSRCMVLVTQGDAGSENWTEHRYIADENVTYGTEAVVAARNIWLILQRYQEDNAYGAAEAMAAFAASPQLVEALNSRAFRASTVELFDQVLADLTAQGFLVEGEDGTLAFSLAAVPIGGNPGILDHELPSPSPAPEKEAP